MLALALVMEGVSRGDAAHACGMDRQTLRDWVHRYNADGLSRLVDRWSDSGPKRRLSPTLEAGMAGPCPSWCRPLVVSTPVEN